MAKKEPILAHGLTAPETEEIRLRMLSKDVEMIRANRAADLQDELFIQDFGNYVIPMHERKHYHVATEIRSFSRTLGARESIPSVTVVDAATWMTFKQSDVFKTYTSEILHNPELEERDAKLVTLEYTLDGQAPEKEVVIDTNPLEELEIKELKEKYEQLSGQVAPKSWNWQKTFDEIEKLK